MNYEVNAFDYKSWVRDVLCTQHLQRRVLGCRPLSYQHLQRMVLGCIPLVTSTCSVGC